MGAAKMCAKNNCKASLQVMALFALSAELQCPVQVNLTIIPWSHGCSGRFEQQLVGGKLDMRDNAHQVNVVKMYRAMAHQSAGTAVSGTVTATGTATATVRDACFASGLTWEIMHK